MVKHLKIFDKINIPEEYFDKIEISKVIIEEAKYLDDEDERECAIHLLQIFKAQMQQYEAAKNMDENERASIELGRVIFYLMTTRMEKIEDNSKKETKNKTENNQDSKISNGVKKLLSTKPGKAIACSIVALFFGIAFEEARIEQFKNDLNFFYNNYYEVRDVIDKYNYGNVDADAVKKAIKEKESEIKRVTLEYKAVDDAIREKLNLSENEEYEIIDEPYYAHTGENNLVKINLTVKVTTKGKKNKKNKEKIENIEITVEDYVIFWDELNTVCMKNERLSGFLANWHFDRALGRIND